MFPSHETPFPLSMLMHSSLSVTTNTAADHTTDTAQDQDTSLQTNTLNMCGCLSMHVAPKPRA